MKSNHNKYLEISKTPNRSTTTKNILFNYPKINKFERWISDDEKNQTRKSILIMANVLEMMLVVTALTNVSIVVIILTGWLNMEELGVCIL